jgi:hypothetical protein
MRQAVPMCPERASTFVQTPLPRKLPLAFASAPASRHQSSYSLIIHHSSIILFRPFPSITSYPAPRKRACSPATVGLADAYANPNTNSGQSPQCTALHRLSHRAGQSHLAHKSTQNRHRRQKRSRLRRRPRARRDPSSPNATPRIWLRSAHHPPTPLALHPWLGSRFHNFRGMSGNQFPMSSSWRL